MVGLKINYNRCINCKQCIITCPAKVFQLEKEQVVIKKNMICIGCLHCAAVCPNKAVEISASVNSEKTVLEHGEFKTENSASKSIEEYITGRRSYRDFNTETVPRDEIMHALEISKWAPSAKNEHPAQYLVLEGRNKLELIMEHIINYVEKTGCFPEINRLYKQGKNIVMGKANTIIIAYADSNATNPHVDTALALHSAELVLQSHGIGTCWSGYLITMCNEVEAIRKILSIPKGNQVYGVILVGYTQNEKFLNVPNRLKQVKVEWI